MTMNRDAAAEGDKVTVTCNYEQTSDTGTPTISWMKDGVALTAEQQKLLSEGDNCGDTQRNRYIISSATTADTGKYKCTATYTINGGAVAVDPNPAAGKDLYIRTLTTTETTYHVEVDGSLDVVCTVTGNEPDSFKWFNADGGTLTGATSVQSSHANNQKTSTLKITAATELTQQKSYKCKASWSSKYQPKSLEKIVELKVYGKELFVF